MNFHQSDSTQGYGGHIGSVKKGPFFNHHISGHTNGKNNTGNSKCPHDLFKFVHGIINTDLNDKNQGKIGRTQKACIFLTDREVAGIKKDMKNEPKKYGRRRHDMLEKQIVSRGVSDPLVLEAMGRVPRHLFVSEALVDSAYGDFPLPIGEGQTISQPFIIAEMTQNLELKGHERVLEIGTGSGYQACVLYELGAKVYSVERVKPLFERTHAFLQKIGYNGIRTFLTDGSEGLLRYGPYDGILVTAGATDVPQALLDQLAVGGRLVIPVGGDNVQKMLRFTREANGHILREEFGDFRFVPFLKGIDSGDNGT